MQLTHWQQITDPQFKSPTGKHGFSRLFWPERRSSGRVYPATGLKPKTGRWISHCYGPAQPSLAFGSLDLNLNTTPSDNCCVNQDGVVHQGCLYTIMFCHLMLWFVNWCILFGALYANLTICWFKLYYAVTFIFSHLFFKNGVVFCFNYD